jgi:ankyrin repeat protein
MTEIPGQPDDEVVELATRLFGYARTGATKPLADYLAAGVPPNLTNKTGDTLIMLAAYHGHAETVRALLAAGADPDCPNDRGQTPLAGATFKGETEVVQALVDGGADPTAGQPSAVDTARMFGQTKLLALFEQSPPSP